ncbi:helix-turn-helix transcriptional regulator [Actinomycetospora chlora]|uniref:Helix-turn-helix transcriptional regulator n=1 Tax=Actinomycetospora chlora TaxID=663608 RepID=A0ABP9BMD7_9PSEU
MSAPGEQRAFGQRVAFLRKKLGLSQAEFASRLDRSETWLSQVERGARRIDRMSVLERLADALGVPVAELAPEQKVVQADVEPAASALSLALSSSDALHAVLAGTRPFDVRDLDRQAVKAWEYAHGSQYDELATLLTDLLPELERSARNATGDDEIVVNVAKARSYLAVAGVLSKLGETGAAWVAVDRAITAAEKAGDPLLMAEGAFRLAIVFQVARRFDLAIRAAESAAHALDERAADGDAPAIAVRGALKLQLAVASARLNDARMAYLYLDEARAAADELGEDRNDYETEFGPTNVLLHDVAVAVELGDAGRALRVAETVDASGLSPERQGRLLIDVARAQAQLRQTDAVVATLRQGLDLAPQQFESHARVRELVADLVQSDRTGSQELRDLAQRVT